MSAQKMRLLAVSIILLLTLMVLSSAGCAVAPIPAPPKPEPLVPSQITVPEPEELPFVAEVAKPITAAALSECTGYKIHNRGKAPFAVVKDIVEALRGTPLEVFAPNAADDIYASISGELGPWKSLKHRAAAMGAAMVVQAGFESSWKYGEGRDQSASNTKACTEEAGLYQTSGNMNTYLKARPELIGLQRQLCKSTTCAEFKRCTKEPVKAFVHGHFMRATRITTRHWGPMVRREINPWLRKACVSQIEALL